MKKFLLASVSLVLLALPLASLADEDEFVAPEDLKAGQKGYGLTVFQGTEPERFEVEFLSVAPHSFYPKEKMILVRLGKPLQDSNIIAGMSGSPIYFKQQGKWKLAGALALGWRLPSTGEAVAGVTPIHLMINQEKVLGLKEAPKLQPKTLLENNSDKLKPGDSVAMVFADGDYRSYGFGTVTYIRGNRFWAFGHRAGNSGTVMIPAYKVEVAISLKSSEPGFKISKALKEPVGVIVYDNVFAIEGKIQEIPDSLMFPVKLQLTDQNGSQAGFSFRVLKNKLYAANLMDEGIATLLENLWSSGNFAGSVTNATVEFENREPVFLADSGVLGERMQWGPFVFVQGLETAALKPVSFVRELLNSDFDFKISGAQIRINLQPAERTFYLDQLKIVSNSGTLIDSARLGEEVNLLIGLRSRDSTTKFLIVAPLKLPDKLLFKDEGSEKTLTIHVQSGNSFSELDESKKLKHPPANPDEFLRTLLLNERPAQKIFLQAVLPQTKLPPVPFNFPPAKWQWQPVKTLDFLKTMEATEAKVLTAELPPPISDFILEIDRSINLKLLPAEIKKPDKPVKVKKKNWFKKK